MSDKKSFFSNLFEKTSHFLTSAFILILFIFCYQLIDTALKPWLIAFFILVLLFFHSSIFVWFVFFLILSFFYFQPLEQTGDTLVSLFHLFLTTAGVFALFLLFRFCVSFLLLKLIRKQKLIPKISQSEREALLAETPWIEKEFFTGRPQFKKLLNQEFPHITQEEKKFLNKEVEELCALSKEWEFIKRKKLSQATENFLKKEKFFGLIIPKSYNGRNFSPFAHAKVIEKLASHNIPLSIIVMVPNSLGPAELLLKYGTSKQKNKYLPRLARAEEWPCFGLTEVQAGSDANSIKSEGILFKEGDQIKIRLNWSKRWITLSSKATLIGLAVRLKDPDKLYSNKKDLGITCLLVSGHTPGTEQGLHHDPMGIPIYNAPIKGRDVVVSAEESIIGGLKNAGKGWKMLMESLSAGRGISLPALAVGSGKKIAWLTGAHALIRKQFGLPIGKFEGVEEALASIAGLTHLMSATQTLTLSSLNQGIHSSVVAALTKYYLTETAQKVAKKGMDVMGGAGLSLGPKNKIALLHISLPMAITVEGANILTRTLIVYGQGLIKTHPQAYQIITALEQNNLKNFHQELWRFFYQLACHFVRGIAFSATRGWLFVYPQAFSKEHRYLQKIAWISSLFSFLSNLSLLTFRDALKTKGLLTGRFADLLSFQYIAIALIWHWKQTGQSEKSWIKTKWGLEYCFSQIQESLEAILSNYPHRWIRMGLKPLLILLRVSPMGCLPSDSLGKKLAAQLIEDEDFRKDLCSNMHFPKDPEDQFQKLHKACKLSLQEDKILRKIKQEAGKMISIKSALKQKIISPAEYEVLQSAKQAQWEAIQVDSFTEKEYFGRESEDPSKDCY